MLSPHHVMLLSLAMFTVGVMGVLLRRNAILILMSIELMLNAANLNLVAFAWARPDVAGQVLAMFVIAVAAGEAAVGLAIIIALFRNRASLNVDEIHLLKW
jgi:NADH-quinone oxidoreductase subunit K